MPGVAHGSGTETFVALRLEIDNWRWAGVPIFIRAGKALPVRATEVRLVLRHTPRLRFLPDAARVEANQIVLRIDPDPGLRLQLSALDENRAWRPVQLDTSFARDLGEPQPPYERLLYDALTGDDRLFVREDASRRGGGSCSRCWPTRRRCIPYPAGSWGPPRPTSAAFRSPAVAAALAANRSPERHQAASVRRQRKESGCSWE